MKNGIIDLVLMESKLKIARKYYIDEMNTLISKANKYSDIPGMMYYLQGTFMDTFWSELPEAKEPIVVVDLEEELAGDFLSAIDSKAEKVDFNPPYISQLKREHSEWYKKLEEIMRKDKGTINKFISKYKHLGKLEIPPPDFDHSRKNYKIDITKWEISSDEKTVEFEVEIPDWLKDKWQDMKSGD